MITRMRLVTIGKLAEATGVNLETIRYYERIGLMPRPARTGGGYRSYEPEHVSRLNFIRRSRELGFTLDEVRGLLRLVGGHRYTCGQIHEITVRHAGEIRGKIADLRRLERVLTAMAAQCEGGQVPECPIVDALLATNEKRKTGARLPVPQSKRPFS
jgi:MerR family mercuric resistance operon transcriptional regulator